MSVTFTSLVQDIPRILMAENSALAKDMPLVIRQAHELIFGVVDHDLYQVRLTPITVAPPGEIDLSSEDPPVFEVRALRMIRPGMSNEVPLFRRSPEWLFRVYQKNIPGEPRYYCETGGVLQLQLFPTPDVSVTIIPVVNQYPRILGEDDGTGTPVETNVLTERAARVLEKACLYQGSLYMKNPADVEMYKREFNEAVVQLNAQIKRRKRDETGMQPIDTTNTGAE